MTTRCTCGDGCLTFGECMRRKHVRVGYCRSAAGGGDYSAQRRWDRELDAYRAARAQGIQPDGTTTRHIREALDMSDATGEPYGNTD